MNPSKEKLLFYVNYLKFGEDKLKQLLFLNDDTNLYDEIIKLSKEQELK